jgi:hypothetical protein
VTETLVPRVLPTVISLARKVQAAVKEMARRSTVVLVRRRLWKGHLIELMPSALEFIHPER